jgi:HD-GYP domain-containing protein (c-di-GMP phosphodiesterase class II)
MPVGDVIAEMERVKGKQFDPNILDIFLKEKLYDSSKAG